MFTEALLVGLVLFVVWFLEKIFTSPMVFRPIVVGTLVGIVLGDPVMGAKCGASLEVVFMGAIQIGAAVPPDAMLGAGIGTALAIITGQGPEVAFTLGFPIAVFGQSVKIVCFIVRSWYMDLACKYAREVQVTKMHILNWGGLILQCTIYGVIGFCTIYFGSSVVEAALNSIPEKVMTSLNIAGGLLPAVGFALLLQPMMTGKNFLYFFLGFILVAFGGQNVLAVTSFGVVLAFIVVFELGKNKNEKADVKEDEELEALFDE